MCVLVRSSVKVDVCRSSVATLSPRQKSQHAGSSHSNFNVQSPAQDQVSSTPKLHSKCLHVFLGNLLPKPCAVSSCISGRQMQSSTHFACRLYVQVMYRVVLVSGWLTLCKARKRTAACSCMIMRDQPYYYASQMGLHNVQVSPNPVELCSMLCNTAEQLLVRRCQPVTSKADCSRSCQVHACFDALVMTNAAVPRPILLGSHTPKRAVKRS